MGEPPDRVLVLDLDSASASFRHGHQADTQLLSGAVHPLCVPGASEGASPADEKHHQRNNLLRWVVHRSSGYPASRSFCERCTSVPHLRRSCHWPYHPLLLHPS